MQHILKKNMNFSRRTKNGYRNKYQKYIWFFSTLAILVVSLLLIYSNYIWEGKYKTGIGKETASIHAEKLMQVDCQEICFSEECLKIGQYLTDNMNASANPCEEYYSFACGGLLGKYEVNESYSVVSQMERSVKLILRDILENIKEPQDEVSKKLKILYESCTSYSASEYNAVPSALTFLSEIGIKDWPHLKSQFSMDMEIVIGKLVSNVEFFLFDFYPTDGESSETQEDLRNFTIRVSYSLMKENEYHIFEEIVHRMLLHLNASMEEAKLIWKDFSEIDSLLWRLKSVSMCSILNFIIEYTDNSEQYSADFMYLANRKQLFELVTNLTQYNHRSIANYMAVRFFFNHLDELDYYFKVLFSEYQKYLPRKGDLKFSLEKWDYCIEWLSNTYGIPLSKLYLMNIPYKSMTEEIYGIFLSTREEVAELINKQLWIEDSKKEEIKFKMESMTNEIDTFINMVSEKATYYIEQIHPTNQSFLLNSLEYRNSAFKLLTSHLYLEPILFNPFRANAYSAEEGAQLTFGLIQPPIFKLGFPKLINLATLSPIIGHEFGHHIWSFFAENLEELNSSTSFEFREKSKCLEDQFSKFEIKKIGKNVKGKETVSENLPDLIGYEIAQKVIENYLDLQNSSTLLPSIPLSTKQLLYVLMTQMWCAANSVESELERYNYDPHAIPEARIVNAFRNLRGFSEAFGCPIGSDMNPHQKCSFFDDYDS